MNYEKDDFSPVQKAFFEAIAPDIKPDRVATALAVFQQFVPVAERLEGVLLNRLATRKSAGMYKDRDEIVMSHFVGQAKRLVDDANKVVADPESFVYEATRFIDSLVPAYPDALADIFEGYQSVDPENDWTAIFANAAISNRRERMIMAALNLEEQGQPRPETFDQLVHATVTQGLYS